MPEKKEIEPKKLDKVDSVNGGISIGIKISKNEAKIDYSKKAIVNGTISGDITIS